MALPKLDTPKYQLTLPSTGQNIEYRPFLVKEQKILMMAQESEDEDMIMRGMSDLVSSCTFNKLDANKLPIFDIEYVFLKIRSKSVGESVDLNLICPDDGVTSVRKKININDIEIQMSKDHTNEIVLANDIKMYLNYPMISDINISDNENETDKTFKLICRCFKELHYKDEIYHRVDIKDSDINDFMDQLDTDQFTRVTKFFETMPKLRHIVEVENPKTKVKSEVLLEGLQSFLG
mgnify:CR=1 FL=1